MAQSLFSFNSYTITLSSPSPTVSQTISLSAMTQGITNFVLDFSQLSFNVKPFKILVNWPNREPINVNSIFDISSKLFPTSFAPISSYTQNVLTSKYYYPMTYTPSVVIYYENGVIHTFSIYITVNPENAIDLDLDVLSIQNTDQDYGTVYNIQSNTKNIVFNSVDNTVNSIQPGYNTDGYV